MQENQKTVIHNSINAKNWLLPTNTKKCLWYFQNDTVTSLPVTQGTPLFVNLCLKNF